MATRKHGARSGHRLKRVRADQVRGNQIVEWAEKRCRVLRVRHLAGRSSEHRRQELAPRPRGVARRGVVLTVVPLEPWAQRTDLHYWADEPVTVLGWSFGDPDAGADWS
jgi:hypothetical protein